MYQLPANQILCRLYKVPYDPTTFNKTAASNPYRGGRFDSVDGSFSYLYFGSSVSVAVAETLLRYTPGDNIADPVIVNEQNIARTGIAWIRTDRPLDLVDLTGLGLHRIGQPDGWLTSCEAEDYPRTRFWAVALRDWAPDAVGFRWRPRHNNDEFAYVLFGDRVKADSLLKDHVRRTSSVSGRRILEKALSEFGAYIE